MYLQKSVLLLDLGRGGGGVGAGLHAVSLPTPLVDTPVCVVYESSL